MLVLHTSVQCTLESVATVAMIDESLQTLWGMIVSAVRACKKFLLLLLALPEFCKPGPAERGLNALLTQTAAVQ